MAETPNTVRAGNVDTKGGLTIHDAGWLEWRPTDTFVSVERLVLSGDYMYQMQTADGL